MENMESIWQVGFIALVAGGLIGALAYRLLAPSLTKADQVRSELESARQELIDYKASVNSHFDKTSELVNDLTQNYVKVYQHLAEGAQTLGGSRELNNLLEQQQGKVLLTVDAKGGQPEAVIDPAPAAESANPDGPPATARETPAAETTENPATKTADSNADLEKAASSATAEPEVQHEGVAAESEAESEAKTAEADDSRAGDRKSASNATGHGESGEPVIDVDRIDRASDEESTGRAKAGSVVAEPTEGIEVPTTRH